MSVYTPETLAQELQRPELTPQEVKTLLADPELLDVLLDEMVDCNDRAERYVDAMMMLVTLNPRWPAGVDVTRPVELALTDGGTGGVQWYALVLQMRHDAPTPADLLRLVQSLLRERRYWKLVGTGLSQRRARGIWERVCIRRYLCPRETLRETLRETGGSGLPELGTRSVSEFFE